MATARRSSSTARAAWASAAGLSGTAEAKDTVQNQSGRRMPVTTPQIPNDERLVRKVKSIHGNGRKDGCQLHADIHGGAVCDIRISPLANSGEQHAQVAGAGGQVAAIFGNGRE